jgi:hypothetical protein
MSTQKTTQTLDELRDRLASTDTGPSTAAATSPWAANPGTGVHSVTGIPANGRSLDGTRPPLSDLGRMRRDAMLSFGLSFVKSYLARGSWHIRSTDPRRAAFVDAALRRIYGRLVLQAGGALDFGYQAIVKNFERENVPWTYVSNGQEIPVWSSNVPVLVWTPFTTLSPRVARPHWSSDGSFAGIDYKRGTSESAPDIPLSHALWITNEKDSVFGSLYGFPRLAYAYRYWWSYWYRFTLADRAYEKWADPPIIAYHPTELATDADGNPRDLTAEALRLAESLRSGANVSLPSDLVTQEIDGRTSSMRAWSLEQMKVEVDFSNFNDTFEYLDVMKLRSLMVPEQAFLEGRGGTSSRNVAAILTDSFEQGQAALIGELYDQINRYMIPQLLLANFGPGGATCEICFDSFDPKDVETSRAIVQAFAQNAPGRLAAVDFRELLSDLGVPLLSVEAAKEAEQEIVREAQRSRPTNVQASEDQVPITDGVYGATEIEREAIVLAETYEPPTMRGGLQFDQEVD